MVALLEHRRFARAFSFRLEVDPARSISTVNCFVAQRRQIGQRGNVSGQLDEQAPMSAAREAVPVWESARQQISPRTRVMPSLEQGQWRPDRWPPWS